MRQSAGAWINAVRAAREPGHHTARTIRQAGGTGMFFDCYCPRRDRTASARARQVEFRGLKPLRCRCVHQGR